MHRVALRCKRKIRREGAVSPEPVLVNFLKTLVAVTLGVALGLTATFFAVERGLGFGAVRAGPWTGWPKAGSRDADPYARAVLSRTGETPLGVAEGLGFTARTDSDGALLDPRCDYSVSGAVPAARWWTLTVLTPEGRFFDTPSKIHGLTSAEVVRDADGAFEIVLSRAARPGNWLQIAGETPFILMLRVYDTTMSATSSAIDARSMPVIARRACA